VNVLTQGISNPPTQAQVQAIQNKLNELIKASEYWVLRGDFKGILARLTDAMRILRMWKLSMNRRGTVEVDATLSG
jgi:hypothetical protein